MTRLRSRWIRRQKRRFHIRKTIWGDESRPRLAVFRSAKHIYVQAVDDNNGATLASASTREKELQSQLKGYPGNCDAATLVGKTIAEKLKKLGVEGVIFDRGGNRFHGRVKALADGAREAGLKI